MTKLAPAMLLLCALSACEPPEARNAATDATMDADNAANAGMANVSDNGAEPARSILRPEVAEPEEPPRIEPAEAVIGFGATPMKLDDAARESLDALIATPAMAAGGPITLRGHSDSRGADGDNKVASRIRAELVRDYLIEKGVAKDRISLIAIGEGRPLAPNVKPDGSDDPEGQAKNRRVEVTVALPTVVVPPPVTPQAAEPEAKTP
jgi:outer membrane protein OmpA-like peptidoglycan-associated protein